MLRELKVSNYAIIDEAQVGFEDGLNVLSGETGAGKSIIIGALGIALGQRAYTEMIRTGAKEAAVEAFFDVRDHPLLGQMGIESSDGIIIRRVVSASGKTKAYVNNVMVTVQALAALGDTLVDIHGQNEHQSLLAQDNQMRLLDSFGGLDSLSAKVSRAYHEAESLRKGIESIKEGAQAAAQRLDLLKYQADEIESAQLVPDEDVRLEEERQVLANLGRLRDLIESSYATLYGDEGSAIEKLANVSTALREMSAIDKDVSDALSVIEQALAISEDASHSIRALKDKYEADPERLSAVEDRLELIKSLKRKYGGSISSILGFLDIAKGELARAETSEESLEEMEEELAEKEKALVKAASELSARRKKAAARLATAVLKVLKGLALEKSEFKVEVSEAPISSSGTDSVEFLFSANRGEALKPLGRAASGGELSRIMLAVKSVLREADDIPVLIFDEVDAGIGGKTAHNVARKLKEASAGRQVLCVTHLPQIASAADNHILIEKNATGGRVGVGLRKLSGNDRQKEIARMLSGSITDTSLEHARELLEKAGRKAGA